MHPVFSIEESLKFGWQKTKEHALLLFQVLLTLFAFEVVFGIVSRVLQGSVLGGLASLALIILGIILSTGMLVIFLKLGQNEKAEYRDLIPKIDLVWRAFLAALLTGILIMVGFVLLIIPGVYFLIRFSMVRFAVLEGASVMESFEKSTKLTDGHKWELLGFFIVCIVLNIIGIIPFGLGLLLTVPITVFASVHVYSKLKHHHH